MIESKWDIAHAVNFTLNRLGLPERPLEAKQRLEQALDRAEAAIVEGRQPVGLTLNHLTEADVPLAWTEQRAALGFAAIG